ncbi:MAG: DUF1508 domain-containing protein [Clostridiales bacterium]|nr:DUF1508 domain-containing protein [Clostridiales bacterium]MDD7506622.1 DUF1508 domain-containing protein [Clostridiales bacterium]MDY5678263.1 DUF1508 domain-containing protein [Eubacteriales bacterium]MDY5725866.1 DUF1508 domain-containing protein [Eubacteriales bacterium]
MGKFIIKKTPSGAFNFSLLASNKQKIAVSSQVYTTKGACKKGMESVGKNAQRCIDENRIVDLTLKTPEEKTCPKFEIYLDKAGMFRYRLIAPNGESLAISEDGYKSKSSCMNGIKSVGVNAMNSQIEDMTLADK